MDRHSVIIKDLTTGYPGKVITSDINATLKSGRVTCLMGSNGAGKSTLLKTLCGFITPLEGSILIDGKPLERIKASEMARTVGVVLTERPATVNMTVNELVALGRSPYTTFMGGLRETDREEVDHAIDMVGINDLRDRTVTTLSDGERQKALIAKALAQDTRIIYLDEPTAFLDFPSKVDIMRLLSRIAADEDKIILLTTHDVELALRTADTIWLLDRRLGLKTGNPSDLAAEGAVSEYFERPGLSFDPATLTFNIAKD